jgi:hypothetical protein
LPELCRKETGQNFKVQIFAISIIFRISKKEKKTPSYFSTKNTCVKNFFDPLRIGGDIERGVRGGRGGRGGQTSSQNLIL